MTIEEVQKIVDDWIKEKGVRYFDELTNTTILMEEVGELARIVSRKYGEQSYKEGEKDLDMADEIADVMNYITNSWDNNLNIQITEKRERL